MTGFNNTLGINIEHTEYENTNSYSIKHQSFCPKRRRYKSRALLQDQCHCCSDFRALVRKIPDAPNFGPLFAFNDGEAELALTSRRCNVATLRFRDVETSRSCRLLTFILVDPTSRRSIHLYALSSSTPECFQKLPFSPTFTPIAQIRYRAIKIRI